MKYNLFLLSLSLLLVFCSKPKEDNSVNIDDTTITLNALSDFELVSEEGFGDGYTDLDREVLAIDAEQFKDFFAIAEHSFKGESGKYDATFSSMVETDGESSYRILIDKELVGEFQNPESEVDFELFEFNLENISIKQGQTIRVEFNSHSNGKIPEGDGFAYSRGRWKSISFSPVQ
ncbi:MAG: hypothetical protein RLN81_04465 [Balneolaceae bacterium]